MNFIIEQAHYNASLKRIAAAFGRRASDLDSAVARLTSQFNVPRHKALFRVREMLLTARRLAERSRERAARIPRNKTGVPYRWTCPSRTAGYYWVSRT